MSIARALHSRFFGPQIGAPSSTPTSPLPISQLPVGFETARVYLKMAGVFNFLKERKMTLHFLFSSPFLLLGCKLRGAYISWPPCAHSYPQIQLEDTVF